jgi:hypothetical protein
MSTAAKSERTALQTYLETLDVAPLDVLPMLAPGFTFSVLWADETGAKEFAGGLDEFHGYLEQRDPEGHLHHVLGAARFGRTEILFGRTSRNGKPLASFVNAADIDDQGRLENFFGARTTTLSFGDLDL